MNNDVQDTHSPNFILKGFTSAQVGLYFLASAYLIKKTIGNFLVDDTFMMFMSVQLMEFFIAGILFLLSLFSSLAIFYSNRRKARRASQKIWNPSSKKRFWIFLTHIIISLSILILLYSNGLYNYIGPVGLILYAFLLTALSASNKTFYLFAFVAILLAVMNFIIPNYWYSSMLLIGVAHFAYGVVKI
ncbi:hypothetical protein RQM59_14020 [Flavobacteriaceae bacterium S356]|uniref:Branched-chain amino acid ABC transporter permease n=1 Tax=Asprobacillus argus TaxID=3076534 RepID=A0ABU3LJX5_9FLAO|nr:hypothetical protein [Flavobacteriaceae bacterium S356]